MAVLALVWCAGLGVAFAQPTTALPDETPLTAEQDERYKSLIHEFRCTVCQNQTIGDSNADLAMDLRNQVRRQVAAGKSDDEVRHFLTDRFGDFILYKPRFTPRTVLLWLGPFAMLAFALFVAMRFATRKPAGPAPAADPDAVKRLLDEERG